MVSLAVFIFGLAIGSFLSAYIYRMEVREGLGRNPVSPKVSPKPSVWRGRSFCPHCGHTLAWHDLIPLLSFALLWGKCRYCKGKISWQYPLVELVTGLVFLVVALVVLTKLSLGVENLAKLSLPQALELLYLWTVGSALVAIFVYDLRHSLIPDILVYIGIGLAVLWRVFEFLDFDILNLFGIWDQSTNFVSARPSTQCVECSGFGFGISAPIVQAFLAGIGASAFFFAIYVFSKGAAMGFGDVKLAFLLGLFLGWPLILVALFTAFCLGALVGLILIAFKKKGLKSEVPFAPFLIIGTAVALFFGSPIIDWYLGLFLV